MGILLAATDEKEVVSTYREPDDGVGKDEDRDASGPINAIRVTYHEDEEIQCRHDPYESLLFLNQNTASVGLSNRQANRPWSEVPFCTHAKQTNLGATAE